MAVTIQGVKLRSVNIQFDEQGIRTFTGSYELISSAGMVLARQDFNGYNSVKVGLSPATDGLLTQAVEGIKAELNKSLGLE